MKDSPFFVYNKDFTLFGTQHIIPIIAMIVLSIALPIIAKRYWSKKTQLAVSRGMAVLMCFWIIFYILVLIWLGRFNPKTDLPFDICNITALLIPFLMWKPRYRVHEIFYFWILAGTMQAIFTPHLYNGFPNFVYIKYWIVHCGLVIYTVYMTTVFDLKPTLRSVWRAFVAFQVYALFVLVVNLILNSNYVYMMHKPPTESALDVLGDWPWYILWAELIGLVFFFIVYLPVGLTRKRGTKNVTN